MYILVVMGGLSTEREISLKSGEGIYNALLRKGYEAEKFVLDKDNVGDILLKKPDCVYLALHGKWGEDGTIQGMLELAGIAYTGSGVASSAVCMNKTLTKMVLASSGLPTPDAVYLTKYERASIAEKTEEALARLGLPVVVKATCQGSSFGVKIIDDRADLLAAAEEIVEYDGELLFEKYLCGTELSVPVMTDSDGVKALPVIEIVSENKFYDFESKYTSGMSHHIIPARIPDEVRDEIELLAVRAYKVLDCSGIARIDFILDAEGKPYVIELNTLPGMTEMSLVPDSAKTVGISYDDIVEKTLLDALNRKKAF